MKLLTIVGARPNFIKLAALHEAFAAAPAVRHVIVHTGQHYDFSMSEQFFQELSLPKPDHHLGIGSGTHAEQVGKTMMALEPVIVEERPDWVVVVGDVNATVAAAMVAKKLCLRLAHVEAGLRSFDWSMPEEINRVVTDRLADLLLVSDPAGMDNLRAEGQEAFRIHFVGNVMIDTLLRARPLAEVRGVLEEYGVRKGEYAVLTMHRPGNVDDREKLAGWMNALEKIAAQMPIVFPVHPRTKKHLVEIHYLPKSENMKLGKQAGYLDMVALLKDAKVVMTDSGGIQEETTALGVPCLTLRDNTERPITVSEGTNTLVGSDPARLPALLGQALARTASGSRPEKWDGRAGERVLRALSDRIDIPPRQR